MHFELEAVISSPGMSLKSASSVLGGLLNVLSKLSSFQLLFP